MLLDVVGGLGMKLICTQQCRLASVDGTVWFLKFKGTARQRGPKSEVECTWIDLQIFPKKKILILN